MVNPGTFRGSRLEFLNSQNDGYAAAVKSGDLDAFVANVQRRYFKRYPITLEHNVEPDEEWLDQVDDDAPDPELEIPDANALTGDEYTSAMLLHNNRVIELKKRKEAIKRRLHYWYLKTRNEKSTSGKEYTCPLAVLTAKLAGKTPAKPRLKTAYNLWGPQNRTVTDPVVNARFEEEDTPAAQKLAVRSAVYKELFEDLPAAEQKVWADRAEEEHRKALADYKNAITGSPSTAPGDRQRVINAVPKILGPILDLIAEYTGWKWSAIGGGPEPADNGRLNMLSLHSGVMGGTVKMDFGRSERQAYRDTIQPAFGRFLSRCFAVDECRSRALPQDHPEISLATLIEQEELDMEVSRVIQQPAQIRVAPSQSSSGTSRREAASGAARKHQSPPHADGHSTPSSTATTDLSSKPGAPKGKKRAPVGGSKNKKVTPDVQISGKSAPSTSSSATVVANRSKSNGPVHTTGRVTTVQTKDAAGKGDLASMWKAKPHRSDRSISHAPSPGPISEDTPPPTAYNSSMQSPPSSRGPSPIPSRAPSCEPGPTTLNGGAHDLDTRQQGLPQRSPSHAEARTFTAPKSRGASHPPSLSSSRTLLPRPSSDRLSSRAASHPPPGAPSQTSPSFLPSRAQPVNPLLTARAQSAKPVSALPPARSQQALSTSLVPAPAPPSSPHLPSFAPSPGSSCLPSRAPLPELSLSSSPPPPPASPHATSAPPSLEPIKSSNSANTTLLPAAATVSASPSAAVPSGSAKVPDEDALESLVNDMKKKRGKNGAAGGTKRKTMEAEADSSTQSSKKRRTAAGALPSPAFDVSLPSECPEWISNAIALLTAQDFGPDWRALVTAWVNFEKRHGFSKSGPHLPPSGRPQVVADWIQRARKPQYRPDLGNLQTFERLFNTWWRKLQPEWRVIPGSEELRQPEDGDSTCKWDDLSAHGQNGILSVVAALCFWGMAAAGSATDVARWSTVVADVHYAITHLV